MSSALPKNKYIDSQNIFPKRLGIYKGSLCLEYYNMQTDKFKKHIIPVDASKSTEQNLNAIFKNPKHNALFRKVERKYIQGVLSGHSIYPPQQQNYFQGPNSYMSSNQQNYSSGQASFSQPSSDYPESQNLSLNSNSISDPSKTAQTSSLLPSSENDAEISSIVKDPQESSLKEDIKEVQEYYEEQFDEYEISQSLGGKGKPKNEKMLPNNKQVSNKQSSEKVQEFETAEKSVKKQKKKKKKKKQETDDFDFEFLDGQQPQKKEKSKKKSKDKSKQKSKQKKASKSKSKKESPKQEKAIEQNVPIQEQFDFL